MFTNFKMTESFKYTAKTLCVGVVGFVAGAIAGAVASQVMTLSESRLASTLVGAASAGVASAVTAVRKFRSRDSIPSFRQKETTLDYVDFPVGVMAGILGHSFLLADKPSFFLSEAGSGAAIAGLPCSLIGTYVGEKVGTKMFSQTKRPSMKSLIPEFRMGV